MKKIAVIVAGGTGSRMNTAVPKQFLLLNGKPILYHTIDVFLRAYPDMEIILVLPKDHIDKGISLINTYFNDKPIRIAEGGATRFYSVQNGLKLVEGGSIVFVHDAVRCLLSADLIHRCFDAAVQFDSAIPVVDAKDSIRMVDGDANESMDRSRIKLVQTPQTFSSKILLPAFEKAYQEGFTDEATVVEAFGASVHLINGEDANIKITNQVDLLVAEKIMEQR